MTNKWITATRAVHLRALSEDTNSFEGRACQYGVKDAYNTTFLPGCFTKGGLDTTGIYSLLWMHDPTRPVGTFRAEERGDGLYIVGKWTENGAGYEARAAALDGSAADLSVGFTWLNDSEELITEARLLEVSQVTSRFGAVPGSVLTAVRTAVEALTTDAEAEPVSTDVDAEETRAADQGTPEAEQEETTCDNCADCDVCSPSTPNPNLGLAARARIV